MYISNSRIIKWNISDDPFVEFIPVNLHVQRMWAHDYNLNKSGYYDTITVGAFTAHCQKAGKEGGLFQ